MSSLDISEPECPPDSPGSSVSTRSLLNEASEARAEVTALHQERDCYEETMKKTFMRGVCALNLEAMTMFQHQDDQRPEQGQRGHISSDFSDNLDSNIAVKDYGSLKTIIQEAIYTTDPRENLAPPKIITSQGARPSSASIVRSNASIQWGTYVRWGRKSYPNNAELVYSGYVGGRLYD